MVICLRRPSPAASSSLPAAHRCPKAPVRAVWVTPRRLFGLAPTGGYRAVAVASGAVGSYPTVSPLPDPASAGHRRSALCCPVRRLSAPRRYLAVYPVELGLSSEGSTRRVPPPRPSRLTSGEKIMEEKRLEKGYQLSATSLVADSQQPIACARASPSALPQPRQPLLRLLHERL
jgi:hypothetical protein